MNATNETTPATAPPMREDLRLAGVLALAAALATALLFPYLQLVMPEALAKVPLPLPVVILLQSGQAAVLLGLLSFCGLRMGHAIGLGAPWLRALLARAPRQPQPWPLAVACGLAVSFAIINLDSLFAAHMPAPLHPLPAAGGAHALAGFLASFYGGIAEEIQLRLFFVTLLAWGLSRLSGGRALAWQLIAAVVLAAIAFGAGHLPAAAQLWPLDTVVVSRTLLLNGLAGLVFGWFYVRHGLESAMLSHFAADLVLHVFAPLAAG
ncbi:MAG: CPBP family glutamic-type intramembrane protease [Arenimonas sp.]